MPDSEKRNFTVDDDPSNWGIRIKRNQSMCLINEYDKLPSFNTILADYNDSLVFFVFCFF